MSLPVSPNTVTPDEFIALTQSWQQLTASGDIQALVACLNTSSGVLSNYAYLPGDLVTQLLGSSATVAIRTKFVLVGDSPAFSMVVYGIDQPGNATTPYFQMGVASVPATIVNDMPPPIANEEIPAAQAAAWTLNWSAINPGNLTFAPFDSSYGMLMGYTFPLDDFKKAWEPATGQSPALWLSFDMHAPTENPEGPLLFSTIVTLNTVPSGDTPGIFKLSPSVSYFDVSRPCPPACGYAAPELFSK